MQQIKQAAAGGAGEQDGVFCLAPYCSGPRFSARPGDGLCGERYGCAGKVGPDAGLRSKAGADVQVPLLVTSDAALGPLLAFELKLDSVTLTGSCGNKIALLSQPLTVEWTHVNGSSEPLLLARRAAGHIYLRNGYV